MKSRRILTGAITALVTPFEGGNVSFDELRSLTEWQIKQGINGLVPVGTTGESPTLDNTEHMDVIRCVIEQTGGRVPVIAGTGSNSTKEAIHLTVEAHTAGADAMLVVAPYYNRPTQEGLFQHFCAIAESTDRPIVLYSIPGRCGIEISVGVVERLRARYTHVNYIKEAGGSVDRVDQLVQAVGDSVTILSGDDSLTLPFIALGAKGVISVASNLYPKAVTQLTTHALKGDYPKARALHRKLYPIFRSIFVESNPSPIKAAMARSKIIGSNEVRSPLCALSAAGSKVLFDAIANYEGAS